MEQMDKVKKNFGFGCMRLPMNGDQVDIAETTRILQQRSSIHRHDGHGILCRRIHGL